MAFTRSSLPGASLLCFLASAVSSLPSDRSLWRRVVASPDISFTRTGCFTDSVPGQRTLGTSGYADDGMTVESCAVFCSNFQFFGVEYGRECYCGHSRQELSKLADDADCYFACAGNAIETCGAGNRIEIYSNDVYSPQVPASLDGIPYAGCFIDDGERVLPSKIMAADDMTAGKCADNCAGYKYFGVEFGRECYCGGVAPTVSAPESECSFSCAGSHDELCGAGMRLNVYGPVTPPQTTPSETPSLTASATDSKTTSTTDSTSATSSSTTASESLSVPTAVTDFVYQGCYTDYGPRVLTGKVTYNNAMTVEMCATACQGYSWFGVEYSQECYCGMALSPASAKEPESECAMKCGGDNTQTCGDANRLNLYSNPAMTDASDKNHATVGGFEYKSCWTDRVDFRSLQGDTYRSDDMSVANCAAYCKDFAYFGVEFSRECYCGNDSTGEAAPEADCSEICMGDATEWCGGPNRLNLYTTLGEETDASSSTSTTWTTSTTSTSLEIPSPTTDTATLTSSDVLTSTTEAPTTITSDPGPSLTTVTDCPSRPTWVGTPTDCWNVVPSQCNVLNTASSGFNARTPGNILSCKGAFGVTVPAAVASCFPASPSPTTQTKPIYDCIAAAPIICQYSSECVTHTYTVGQVPTVTPTALANPNILVNGDFETGDISGWSLTDTFGNGGSKGSLAVQNYNPHTGTMSYRLSGTDPWSASWHLVQNVRVEPGATYQLSFWWYQTSNSAPCSARFNWNNAVTAGGLITGQQTYQWVQYLGTFTASQSSATADLAFGCNDGGGGNTLYLDSAELVKIG